MEWDASQAGDDRVRRLMAQGLVHALAVVIMAHARHGIRG